MKKIRDLSLLRESGIFPKKNGCIKIIFFNFKCLTYLF